MTFWADNFHFPFSGNGETHLLKFVPEQAFLVGKENVISTTTNICLAHSLCRYFEEELSRFCVISFRRISTGFENFQFTKCSRQLRRAFSIGFPINK